MIQDYVGWPLDRIPPDERTGYELCPVTARDEHSCDPRRTGRLMAVKGKTLYVGFFRDGEPKRTENQV